MHYARFADAPTLEATASPVNPRRVQAGDIGNHGQFTSFCGMLPLKTRRKHRSRQV